MPDYLNNLINWLLAAGQTFWSDYILAFYRSVLAEYTVEISAGVFLFLILVAMIILLKKRGKRRRIAAEAVRLETIGAPTQSTDRALAETVKPPGKDEFEDIPRTRPSEIIPEEADADLPAEEAYLPEPEPEIEEIPPPAPPERVEPEPVNLMRRLKSGLLKTRNSLTGRIETIFSERQVIDETTLEEIEEALITSDVGVNTTMALIRKIEENASRLKTTEDLRTFLKGEMLRFMADQKPMEMTGKPHVIMVVGVNGVGKTTTIGKLANKYTAEGKKVLLGAADTFRAAAVEQLEIWAERAGVEIVKHRENADPAAVAFDSVEAALARKCDIVIIDTAGRLHTKVNLMEQLKKIKRSIAKRMPDAPHEVLLVVDATTGQNALSQAKLFNEGIGLTSIILTKLDGTAKGGIVIGICNTMKLPLRYIGVGESIEDLQPFDPERFVEALF